MTVVLVGPTAVGKSRLAVALAHRFADEGVPAEIVNATAGIGYLMATAREFFQTDVIVVCLVVYALLGLAVDFVVRLLERSLLAWRPSFTGT